VPVSDIRALGRLGEPITGRPANRRRRGRRSRLAVRRGGGPHVFRRPRIPRLLTALLLLTVVSLGWLGVAAGTQTDPPPGAAAATVPAAAVPQRPQTDGRASRAGASANAVDESVFAAVDGLRLTLPHAAPEMVAFHEASRAEALEMSPQGALVANDNPTRFTPGPPGPGPDYTVLSSRGRARPAASAADIVVPEGAAVLAPVTGRVVEAREYALYERTRDWRIVIEPADRSDLHVVLIHLEALRVAVGDQVVAGETPLAAARLLPFASHVDYATGVRHPHTHIEVKAAEMSEPFDPNAPAVAPEADASAPPDA